MVLPIKSRRSFRRLGKCSTIIQYFPLSPWSWSLFLNSSLSATFFTNNNCCTHHCVFRIEPSGQGKRIACLCHRTSAVYERSVWSGSWEKTVVDWNLNTGKTIRKFADTICHWWTLHCTVVERYGQTTMLYEIRADVVANLLGLFYALDPGEVGLVNDHFTHIHRCPRLITERVLFLKYPLPRLPWNLRTR